MSYLNIPEGWDLLTPILTKEDLEDFVALEGEEFSMEALMEQGDVVEMDLRKMVDSDKKDAASKRQNKGVGLKYDIYNNIMTKENESIADKQVLPLMKLISKHMTEVIPGMSAPYPTVRIKFTKNNEMNFLNESKIPLADISKAIKSCDLIKDNWQNLNNPFLILASSLIVYYHKNQITMGKESVSVLLSLYLAIKFYRMGFQNSFPQVDPNPQIMEAAMTDLMTSKRLSIKKYKTIFGVVNYIARSHYKNFQHRLDDPNDYNVTYYITNLLTRVKSIVNSMAKAYYKYQKAGIKQSTDQDMIEDENGDVYLNDNIENISKTIASNTRKYFTSFCSEITADRKALELATNISKISYYKSTITINSIISSKEPLVEELMMNMFSYFFLTGGKKIKSKEFTIKMEKIFATSNSVDKNIIAAKDILHKIMNKYSKEYVKTNNVSTISNMKKTLFLYIVFYILRVE